MTDEELLELHERERVAYYHYVATSRGDTTNGRVLPHKVRAASAAWTTLSEQLDPERERLTGLLRERVREEGRKR